MHMTLKETRNSIFCVTPENHRSMIVSLKYIKNHSYTKSNCVL